MRERRNTKGVSQWRNQGGRKSQLKENESENRAKQIERGDGSMQVLMNKKVDGQKD